jgi:hypothetical protein
MMTSGRSRFLILALFLALTAGAFLAGLPASANPNDRLVKSEVTGIGEDRKGKLWVLDFKFRDPRLIKVNIPGRGQTVCWYLWYQVMNRDSEPHTFIPEFELVTHDSNPPMAYRDQVLPTVQEAIQKLEDPTDFDKIKNSVTVASSPIRPSLPKRALPKAVTGVAIWTDPNEPSPDDDAATKARKERLPKLADSNRYSIFIAGLSNGWAFTDPVAPGGKPVVRRKTLQLSFKRLGDRHLMRSEAIQFVGPPQWIYRGSTQPMPGSPEPAPKEKAGK